MLTESGKHCIPKWVTVPRIIIFILLMTCQVGITSDFNDLNVPDNMQEEIKLSPFDVNSIVKMLDKEDLDTSLKRLANIRLYTIGGIPSDIELNYRNIPLNLSAGKTDIWAILANRRFLKIYKELSEIPKEQADQKVYRHLVSSVGIYKGLFESSVKNIETAREVNRSAGKNPNIIVGFGGYAGPGRLMLRPVHYKILTLILITGKLKLSRSGQYLDKILEIALEQRSTYYKTDSSDIRVAAVIMEDASLYNRQILATALLGILSDEESQKILQQSGKKMINHKLTSYNADATIFEASARGRGPDYTKGTMDVKIIEPISDAEFDKIVESVKALKSTTYDSNNPKKIN